MRPKIKIKINDIFWTVYGVEADSEELDFEDEVVFGLTKFSTSEIFVQNEEMNTEVVYRTIRHELTHAFLYSYGYDGSSMDEEAIANFVECFAESIVNDARKIFDHFQKISLQGKPSENVALA